MKTIAENLQIIKDSTEAIKQAIIDKGGTISGDITTYAKAIEALVLGESLPTEVVLSDVPNENNAKVYDFISNLKMHGSSIRNLLYNYTNSTITLNGAEILYSTGLCNVGVSV